MLRLIGKSLVVRVCSEILTNTKSLDYFEFLYIKKLRKNIVKLITHYAIIVKTEYIIIC